MKRLSQPLSLFSLQVSLLVDILLAVSLAAVLFINASRIISVPEPVFVVFSILGLVLVAHSALTALFSRSISIDLLASVALIFSLLAREWQSAAFINLMLGAARIFDAWTDIRTRNIISHLLKFRPETVKVKERNKIVVCPIEHVVVGDSVFIEAGERIPVDGTVISGSASVDQATLTGESEPRSVTTGDAVYDSTLNLSGSLVVQVTKPVTDSSLMRMVKLVEEASRKKSPTERIAGQFTQWYILITLVGSVALYGYSHNMALVLSVLLVVCADDIAVAIPLTFTSAIALGAKHGILIKGSDVLETLPNVAYIITDKTGTLTKGKPAINNIIARPGISRRKFLQYAGEAAQVSDHPINKIILEVCHKEGLSLRAPSVVTETPGEGILVWQGKVSIAVGKFEYVKNHLSHAVGVKTQTDIDSKRDQGFGISALVVDGVWWGYFVFSDVIKPEARSVIRETKRLGIRSWTMLTGDNEKIARRVANDVGIDRYRSSLSPEGKIAYLNSIHTNPREKIAMIGDGVNDAATLAQADVAIAMGAIGSDVAIETADIALMDDSLKKVLQVMILARKTQKVAKENFLIWGVTNGIGLTLVFGGFLGPPGAAAYNFVTDFFPILNALRINMFSLKYLSYNG